MKIFPYTTKMLESASPAGLLLGGTVLFLGLPLFRKGLRYAAVLTARAIYSITDEAKKVTTASRESMEDILNEAKNPNIYSTASSDFAQSVATLKTGSRRLAVAATMGALTVSDKAKSLYKDASVQVKNIVDEAKSGKESSNSPELEATQNSNHHHLESDDLPSPTH